MLRTQITFCLFSDLQHFVERSFRPRYMRMKKMSDIINFPEKPNKFGIKPTVAQELIENGYNPNSIAEIKKWIKDMKEGKPDDDGYA